MGSAVGTHWSRGSRATSTQSKKQGSLAWPSPLQGSNQAPGAVLMTGTTFPYTHRHSYPRCCSGSTSQYCPSPQLWPRPAAPMDIDCSILQPHPHLTAKDRPFTLLLGAFYLMLGTVGAEQTPGRASDSEEFSGKLPSLKACSSSPCSWEKLGGQGRG